MSDYEVTPSAVINTADQLLQKGLDIINLGHKAFDLISNLGMDHNWVGKQFNNVVHTLNSFTDEMNQLFTTVSYSIPINLSNTANIYAQANDEVVTTINANEPSLLETIIPPQMESPDTIIYHQSIIEETINEFTSTVQSLQDTIQDYQSTYIALVSGNWVGEAMESWTNTLNEFLSTAFDLSDIMNKTVTTQASDASNALATAEKINTSNVSMN